VQGGDREAECGVSVRVDNGKYDFHIEFAGAIQIFRYGQSWHRQSDASNAIGALIRELDAARVVLDAVRAGVNSGDVSTQSRIGQALARHDRLVEDREPPSEWCTP
jgi:hypothetical protein